MTSISTHGAVVKLSPTTVTIIPTALAASLGSKQQSVPLANIKSIEASTVATTTATGTVTLHDTATTVLFAPGKQKEQEEFIAIIQAALSGQLPKAAPGLDFVALDVETANADWGSICQIGIAVVRDGQIESTQCWLCQPPESLAQFDNSNIAIHGIRPEDVTEASTFAEVLPDVVAAVGDLPLIAHNAQFDFTAISRACAAASITVPQWQFACSLAAARAAKLAVNSHRLPVVATHLGVSLRKHHDAVADAEACAGIIIQLALRSAITGSLETVFDSMGFNMGNLNGERVYPVLSKAPSQRKAEAKPKRATQPPARWAKAATPDTVPTPNPDADPNHPLYGHNITLTGDFEPFDKGLLWEKMAQAGASIGKNVTKKTTMLVMGPWDSVTSKQKRAEQLISQGQEIEMWQSTRLLEILGLEVEDEPPF